MYIANAIGRTRMERMLANIRLEDIDASRAIRACIAPDPDDPSATRIGQHLRMIGQAKLARQAFTRSTEPQTGNSDVLRVQKRLAGVDTEGASGLDRHLAGDDSNLTELEAVVLFALRARMQSTEAFRAPWRRSAWREVVERLLPEGHPARQADRGERHTNRISVHGFASDGTGLGKNMWMSMQALKSCGLPAELCPVDGSSTTSLPTLATANHEVLTRNVALHHVNADRIPLTIFEAYRHRPAYQIGFLLWELDRIPRAHRLALDMLDEIWVPSAFLQKIYQPAFSGRVILMRKGIDVPDVAKEALPAGLEKKAGVTRFVVAFDANSSVSRKNPLAAVRAFCRAFGPERHDVELIIKSTPVAQEHWGDPEGQMGEIAAIAAEDPRIRPVCRYCTFPQLLKLIESADALISPHRAEGFGYLPAYALLLGRPTIVTDYSGTRDFCTESTCIPVPYRLRRVPRQHSILPTSGARWAEIDGDALVESLRWVKRNPEAALARAGHGRNLMQIEYGMEAQATRYRLRLEQLGLVAGTQHFENGREQQGA